MANVHIREGYKDAAWFTANASLILKQGQRVNLLQTGTYKLGDGVTQLSALTFLGGGDTVDVNTIGAAINGAASATPNDTDLVISVESSVAKKNTWTQIKAFLKTYFDTLFVKKGTLTTNFIPKATATDTIGNSSIYDDGTTVKINNKTEITDNDFTLYNTSYINARLDTSDTYGGSLRIYNNLGNLVANITGKDFATYFNTNYSFGIGTATPKSGTKFHVKTNTNQNLLVYEYNGKLTIQAENDAGSAYSSLQFYCDFELPLLTASQIVGTDINKKLVSIPFGTTAGTVLEGNAITQTITNGVIDKSPSEDAVFDGLTLKVDKNTSITGATKTKITYDSKGLVTSGADATTADIADSLNKRYVTDANLTVIGNTSGTNTGDQTLSGLGGVPTTRSLTINGTTYDLSADRTWTISTASNVAIKDEGSVITSAVTSIDFTGSAVTTTAVGNDVTVNITGGGVASATNNLFSYYNFI